MHTGDAYFSNVIAKILIIITLIQSFDNISSINLNRQLLNQSEINGGYQKLKNKAAT